MATELDVWLAFFGDMTRAEFALRRAANTVPFIDIDPAIAVRLEAAAEEVAALARAVPKATAPRSNKG
jgi:hypothetical protein